ncbi:MAG: FIVAR domain-containing protein [Treponema sp.]|jgi:molybdopterin-guanine dinucleotide biosynthesis protein A|nr:FIVAR domain-containing protein [Treponema sp.]
MLGKAITKIVSVLIVSAFLMGMLACEESGGGGGAVAPNLTALDALINEADQLANETMTADSADKVPVGKYWSSQEAKDAFRKSIAQAIRGRQATGSTQATIEEARQALEQAVAAFEAERQQGTKVEVVNKTALNTAITTANGAKSGINVAASADEVPKEVRFVTQAVMDALNAAIADAQAIAEKADATQAEVDAQVTALNSAVSTFNAAKALGTNETIQSADKTALTTAITTANSAKSGITVGASADAVASGVRFVTQTVMDALDAAIATAEAIAQKAGATQAEVDAQVTVLNNAVSTFNAAKQTGAKAVDKSALTGAITAADGAKSGINVAASADEVPLGIAFVTQAVMDALNAAITAAEAIAQKAGATQAEVDAQVIVLNSAVTTFNAAKGTGTNETIQSANKTALTGAITAANSAKSGIVVGTSAGEVASGAPFVTQTVMDALNAAITAAQAIVQQAGATQAQVDAQVTALNNAVSTFTAAKQTGAKIDTPVVDKGALTAAIAAAGNAKNGITVAATAGEVALGVDFVTQAVMDALNAAITAAQAIADKADATQAQVDAQVTALNNAVSTFNTAKGIGTNETIQDADKTALTESIAAADNAKSGIVVGTSADEVASGVPFVTQTVMDALNAAIADAQAIADKADATQAEVNAQVIALNNAVTTFNDAKQTGTNTDTPVVDKTALTGAITAANSAKSGIVVGTSAGEVASGVAFVTQAVMDALDGAIADAQAIVQQAGATQAQVDAQVSALNNAVSTFTAAKQTGANADAPALLIFNQGSPAAGTTTAVPALNGANRLVFSNTNPEAQFPNDATLVAGNTVVYLNTPMEGAFTFSARVKITARNTQSYGGASGVIFGALANPAQISETAPLYPVRFVGARMGTDGVKRLYRSTSAAANGATGTTYDGYWDEEFILKVERTSSQYTLGFYNSKDVSDAKGTWTASSGMIADLVVSAPVYPGLIIGAVDVEVSNISITAGGQTVFSTPATTASPWAAKSVTVSTSNPIGAGDGYDYQSIAADFPPAGVPLIATVEPTNADNLAVTWSISAGGANASVTQAGVVTINSITDSTDITVKAASSVASIYGEFKFHITKDAPQVTGVTVSGTDNVMVGKSAAFTAEVAPAMLSQEVTWRVANGTGQATIAAGGVLSATKAGAVTVYAKSVAQGAGGDGVESAGYPVTITPYERLAWWNFQTLPTGWTENSNYSGSNTTYRDVNDELDMVFLGSRGQKVETTAGAPAGSSFSNGRHTSGGTGDFATISEVQGPFTIILNYASNNDNARRPAVKVNGTLYDGGELSGGGTDPKTYIYTYTGTDKVTVTLTNGNSSNPGSIYDVIIKDPSSDLPIIVSFTDKGAGAFNQGDFTLSRSGAGGNAKTKSVSLAGSWDSVEWFIDGKSKGTGNSVYINSTNYTLGGHTLEVEVTKDGVPWSKGAKFTVTN